MNIFISATGVVIVGLLGVISYLLYDQKQVPPAPPAQQSAQQDTVLKVPTGDLEASLQLYANEHELIRFLQLVDVDITRNTRRVVWHYSDTLPLELIYKEFEAKKIGDTPWLSADPAHNARQLSIIHGAFSCTPVDATPLPKLMPGIEQHVKHVCVVAIPPDYAKFSGYLSAWLSRQPTEEEILRLVEKLRAFASRIY